MWFPSTCHDFCLVGVDLMIPFKNIWTVWGKSRQTIPNCSQLCCAVSQKMLCLHYCTVVPFLPHGACQTVGAHGNCGSRACVTGGGHTHASLCSTVCICTRLVPPPSMSSRQVAFPFCQAALGKLHILPSQSHTNQTIFLR